jgi:hypothetical protein
MAKNKLTREGLEKYQEELDYLKSVRRKEISQKIKEAREQGDLSENAEYDAARDEQRDVEARIDEIEALLKDVEVLIQLLAERVDTRGECLGIGKSAPEVPVEKNHIPIVELLLTEAAFEEKHLALSILALELIRVEPVSLLGGEQRFLAPLEFRVALGDNLGNRGLAGVVHALEHDKRIMLHPSGPPCDSGNGSPREHRSTHSERYCNQGICRTH